MLKHLIDQLSSELWEGEKLSAADDGSYTLHFEPNLDVTLKESLPTGFAMFSSLTKVPPSNKEGLFLRLMSANLLGKETGEAVLGLSANGQELFLSRHLSADTNYRQFHESLEDFINYAESWRLDASSAHSEGEELR